MNLFDKINEAGVENCVFLVPMRPVRTLMLISYTSSSDPEYLVPATISEERYKLKDEYKTTLKSIYPEFGKEHFYLSDLELMIKQGTIQFLIKQKI